MKKLLFVFLTCLCAMHFSGCSLQDAIDDWVGNNEVDSLNKDCNSTLSSDSAFSMSSATRELASKYSEANSAMNSVSTAREQYLAEQESKGWFGRGWNNFVNSLPWTSGHSEKGWDRELEKHKITVENLSKQYESAKASDAVYQKSVEDSKKQKTSSTLQKLKPFLIGGVLLLVVLFLITTIVKKPRKPKVVVQQAPAPAPVQRTGLLGSDDSQQRDFQNFCSQNGLDYNAIVAKVGTDAASIAKAKTKINYLLNHGGVESVNLWLSNT